MVERWSDGLMDLWIVGLMGHGISPAGWWPDPLSGPHGRTWTRKKWEPGQALVVVKEIGLPVACSQSLTGVQEARLAEADEVKFRVR